MRDMEKFIRKKAAVRKELDSLQKQEQKLAKAAGHTGGDGLAKRIEDKIPEKIHRGLEKAFCTAFGIVFERGTQLIEKSYCKEDMQEKYAIQNFSVELRGTRRELRKMKRSVEMAGMGNLAVTAVEGIGLGALGIGLPDIVIFTSVMLKGVYETALRYGFEYDSPGEKLLILKLLETSVSKGEDWEKRNAEIDALIHQEAMPECTPEEMKEQAERTAAAFAADMLLLKFIQGLPVVGMVGGIGNPVYYSNVMKYVVLKYRKRYLLRLERGLYAET